MGTIFVKFEIIDGESQEALFKEVDGKLELIMMGDYYHDKISDRIEGFLEAYKYNNMYYKLKRICIEPGDEELIIHDLETEYFEKLYNEGK